VPAKLKEPELGEPVGFTSLEALVVPAGDPELIQDIYPCFGKAGSGDSQLFGGGRKALGDDVGGEVVNQGDEPDGGGVGIPWPGKLPDELRQGHGYLPGLVVVRMHSIQPIHHLFNSLAVIRGQVA